jgi:DNA-binding NtrC family response regulator
MAGEKVLIVDDDDDIREVLLDRLGSMGYETIGAADGREGLETIRRESPDVVFLDIRMPQMDGYEVLERLRGENQETVVVVITAHGSVVNAVRAMQLGAFDFVEKPFDPGRIEVVLEKALGQISLRREHTVLREELEEQTSGFVGEAPLVKEVLATARRAATSDATMLIMGESGTGKEVLARAIHDWSGRHHLPFVAVNCAALPDQLLESTLFGHERGAFTGAVSQKKGKFELARGGTILLDEIAELKPELQVKLLRVLQEGIFERLGGTHTIRADVRIIAATNRNLEEAMAEGQFREDLFYRLNVVAVTLPPLRQRKEDIPSLADHFLKLYSRDTKRRFRGISDTAMKCLAAYSWPGNVRELGNAIERAVVLGDSDWVEREDLPTHVLNSKPGDDSAEFDEDLPFHEAVEAFKRRLILQSLQKADGNQSKAAQSLDLQRTYLARLITNLNLRDVIR